MNPVRFAVERPYTVAVAVLLTVLFSWLAFVQIPVQLKPTVDRPVIRITTVYPGASAVEMEEQITREIEDLLQGAEGLQKLTSVSSEGVSTVSLEYQWGVDKDSALVDVSNKLQQLPPLPAEAEEPVASLGGEMGENNSMWIVVNSSYSPNRIRQYIEEEVEPRLSRVEGVTDLMIVGGAEREVQIWVDPHALAARNISFAELETALRRGFVDRRGGTVETPTRQWVVRTEGRSSDPKDLEEILVRRDASGTVKIGDVANVMDTFKEISSIVHTGGRRTVAIGVSKESGANVVRMIEGVETELENLNQSFTRRGLDMELKAVYRDTTYLNQAMDFVQSNLLLGAGLAVAVLLMFLRSFRSVLIVGLAIPISLITVFLVMQALGRTLNVISLAGLAFAAGMVVDNAIVVLENIFRHLEKGKSAREAAIDGGREVWGGVLAATLTTVAVFLPILGIEEEAGQLFADLALAIATAVSVSLLAALLVVPSLSAILFRRRNASVATALEAETKPQQGWPTRIYGAILAPLVNFGWRGVGWKLALFMAVGATAITAWQWAPAAGYLPTGNRNLILYFGQPIPGMRPEAMEENMAELEQWLLSQPEIDRYFLVVARSFNGGGVVLKEDQASGQELQAFQQKFMPLCTGTPGFRFLIPIQASLFMDSGKQFTLEITGPDLGELAQVAERLQLGLMQFPQVQALGVSSDYIEGRPEIKVRLDAHRATELGMTTAQVGEIVETAVAGRRIGKFSDGGRDYDLMLRVPASGITEVTDLQRMSVIAADGSETNLGTLASIEQTSGPQSVNRLERERAITLTVNLNPDAVLQSVLAQVEEELVSPLLAELPSSYRIQLGGSADKFSRTLEALTDSFWLAILISYLLLVALFRSWLMPVVILVTVPLALSGGVFGIALASKWSFNASYDLLAMLGFIILAGVVVNNAILIVHQSNNLRDAGLERRQALRQASQGRLRPIVMSVTTSVFGMLPLAIGQGAGSELYQGLAAVVVGGLLLSTVFTLFLVPAMVSGLWDMQDLIRRALRHA